MVRTAVIFLVAALWPVASARAQPLEWALEPTGPVAISRAALLEAIAAESTVGPLDGFDVRGRGRFAVVRSALEAFGIGMRETVRDARQQQGPAIDEDVSRAGDAIARNQQRRKGKRGMRRYRPTVRSGEDICIMFGPDLNFAPLIFAEFGDGALDMDAMGFLNANF